MPVRLDDQVKAAREKFWAGLKPRLKAFLHNLAFWKIDLIFRAGYEAGVAAGKESVGGSQESQP